MKKKNNLFYIYSFKSDFIINNVLNKNFEYDTIQARKDLNLVSLADNAVFQFLTKIRVDEELVFVRSGKILLKHLEFGL